VKRQQRNPILPADTRDRTGSRGILRRAVAQINRRWAGLLAEALSIFASVRIVARNDAADFRTVYALTPDEAAAVSYALQQAVDRWIAAGREPAYQFWGAGYTAEAAQLGAAQSVANLTAISAAYAAERSLQSVLYSEAYRNRVAAAQVKSYDHWTQLAAEAKAELSQIIGRAVVDGKNPRAVVSEIRERLDVSKSRAKGYAQTDITDTLRQARMAERDDAVEALGLNIGLLWTSAFLPTTRPTHAARHGKAYTSGEVRDFYSRNGNRYRCHCSITEVMLDDDDRMLLSQSARDKMRKERADWQRENLNT
jgi:hypothetical protein